MTAQPTSPFTPAIREFLAAPEETRRLGPYRCKDLLDKAGTAPVFRAVEEHAGLSLREVAVKVFDIGKNKNSRVLDEARSLCRVQHPNVIRFHTLSTDQKRGLMGLVMEFAEGISLDREIADLPKDDPKRVALAVEAGIDIASALAAAHESSVVHCNVKPSNIMLTGGVHKLINFGIAASLQDGDSAEEDRDLEIDDLPPDSIGRRASVLDANAAAAGAPLAGTIGYIDPVCVRTTSVPTAASDLYSLGATLYQVLAGDVPAVATGKSKGASKVDAKVLTGDVRAAPIAEVTKGVPADLAKLVDSLVSPTREARPRSAEAVLRSLERIRSVLAGRERSLPPVKRGPFPGLDRYEASDRDVFFGRSAEIAGILELARTRGLVGIVGMSGTGKSSLARAGVVPAIEDGALGGWPPKFRSVVVTPGEDLMKSLEAELSKVIGEKLAKHPEEIAQQLSADVDAKKEGIVILVDQLEEIVRTKSEGRMRALDLLSRLAEAPVGLRAVVVVRRDFLDEVLAIDPVFARALSRGVQLIGPLSSTQWGEVLDQSLEAYGYELEASELRGEILEDLRARESAMPLIQYGLARMWAARDDGKKIIPRKAFSANMRGALEHHADKTVGKLSVSKDKLRDILLALTTAEGTRTHVKMDELTSRFGADARTVVEALEKARLVSEEIGGVTFMHDSILKEWSALRSSIEAARDDRLLVAHIERDATRWAEAKDPAYLWRKGRLASGIELWKRGGATLSDTARDFLTKSSNEEAKSKIAFWTMAAIVVLLVVGGSLVYAKESRERAEEMRQKNDQLAAALADVKTLKAQAEENAAENAVTAQMLHDLQQKSNADQNAKVQAAIKKVTSATSLDSAQKAAADLQTASASQSHVAVPRPADLTRGNGPSSAGIDTSGPGPAGGGGGTFDQAAIERVVNTRKAGVKRTCLERSASTASSTKETATITIAPNGSVQNVSTTGDDPVMGKCIEQQLKTWSFPAPGETKTVQIPFVFVRQ